MQLTSFFLDNSCLWKFFMLHNEGDPAVDLLRWFCLEEKVSCHYLAQSVSTQLL